MMKKTAGILFAVLMLLCAGAAALAQKEGAVPVFEDGMAQPVLEVTNLRNDDYTNEGSDILRFCVYVETDHDTDGDGKADLVEVLVQVPRLAAEGLYRAGTIYDPTPYGAGTVSDDVISSSMVFNPVPFDYDKLYAPGKKRTPKGAMTTLEAAERAEAESWNYTVPISGTQGYSGAERYNYFLARGFAVVEAGGIGTYGSEGFELCGFDLERDAHRCVVEWLTGDRAAFTDPYDDIRIEADWSNGNVAMTGTSYGGTLPFEVATSGVRGLRTIIPYAGIASWYDYTNSQGAPMMVDADYGHTLAFFNSGAAFLDDDWTVVNDDYASFLWQFAKDQKETNGDYDDIWERLDYTLDPGKISCSALIVHGLNDFNVTTKHADLMARAFAAAGQPFKLVFHQDGHNHLVGRLVNGEVWDEIVNKWLSHYLYDVDNGIENMPAVSVQSNVDGSYVNYASWGDFVYDTFPYDREMNPDDVSHVDTTAIASYATPYMAGTDDAGRENIRDNFYPTLPDSACATYLFDLPEGYTFCGIPEVHLRLSSRNVDLDGLVFSALLLDTIDYVTPFKAYMTQKRIWDTVPAHTIGAVETGRGLPRTRVRELVKSSTTTKLITFGHGDLANPGGGYEGKEYRKNPEKRKAGEYYDYTLYLQPTSYTFEPGHRAVLIVTGWDPYRAFLDEDFESGKVSDATLSSYTYAFNIDNSALELRLPRIAETR